MELLRSGARRLIEEYLSAFGHEKLPDGRQRVVCLAPRGRAGGAVPSGGQAATFQVRPMEWNSTSRASLRVWTVSKSLTAWAVASSCPKVMPGLKKRSGCRGT